jgi:hypothetical protein
MLDQDFKLYLKKKKNFIQFFVFIKKKTLSLLSTKAKKKDGDELT